MASTDRHDERPHLPQQFEQPSEAADPAEAAAIRAIYETRRKLAQLEADYDQLYHSHEALKAHLQQAVMNRDNLVAEISRLRGAILNIGAVVRDTGVRPGPPHPGPDNSQRLQAVAHAVADQVARPRG